MSGNSVLLNNVSLDRDCKESYSHHLGSVEIRSLEFVDDIADLNSDRNSALTVIELLSKYSTKKLSLSHLKNVNY